MENQETSTRGAWGSKIAFVFAAAGSAIGLGNIWRYPMMVGLNGGAVFVFANILAVIIIGFTVMLAEFAIGRHTRKNPVGSYNAIKPGTPWKLLGYLNVAVGIGILSFYGVIAGWAVGYFFKAILFFCDHSPHSVYHLQRNQGRNRKMVEDSYACSFRPDNCPCDKSPKESKEESKNGRRFLCLLFSS